MTIQADDKASAQPALEQCWRNVGVMGDGSCPRLDAAVHCRNCPIFAEAGQRLFEREPPAEYIDERTILLSKEAEDEFTDSEAVIVFRIREEWLALDVNTIVEVAKPRTIHRVPHRPDQLLLGIVNIRGELQLCVSLRRLLRIADGEFCQRFADIPCQLRQIRPPTYDKEIVATGIHEIHSGLRAIKLVHQSGHMTLKEVPHETAQANHTAEIVGGDPLLENLTQIVHIHTQNAPALDAIALAP